jgi:hypothetical protein
MKTGPHGAWLTAASFLAKQAKLLSAEAAGNPVLELSHRVEPVASAASVGAERRARSTRAARSRALCADIGWTMRLSALRFPFLRVILSENRNCTFRDHALSRKRVEKSRFVRETDSLDRPDRFLARWRAQHSDASHRENDVCYPSS